MSAHDGQWTVIDGQSHGEAWRTLMTAQRDAFTYTATLRRSPHAIR